MKTMRFVLVSCSLVALGGCTVFSSFSEVEALNDAKAVGSPFTQALTNEYRAYSNVQLKQMMDYPDALHFARKGLASARGEVVLPEPVADWNLSEPYIAEIAAGRGRLITAYDLGARESAPQLAARVQAKFDCWIEQQEETSGKEAGPTCKNDFMKSITELESGLQPGPAVAQTAPQEPALNYGIDPNAPMAAENAMYLVFFNWDSSKIGEGANSVIGAVTAEVEKNPPQSINVTGFTDTSGGNDYNMRLATRRAKAVRDALLERGIDASMIKTDARGESELMVDTADNVREPANRRVSISFN